ncbi:MAG TPA: cob(I)yrinic acid a,c-diamide adenosyltransferase [Phycisphaerae bacterium]|nr:cob(I)yrinic acid a,c-diamide adenosyltransferase [Phycisphaerae bacterium]
MALLDQGLVQVYTGNGKGKTTAALGQALRALGRGAKVCMYQFLKPTSFETGESIMATRLAPDFKLVRLEQPWSLSDSLSDPAELARMGAAIRSILPEIVDAVDSGDWDLVILDEIIFCLSKGIISQSELFEIIEARDDTVELILTGRGATPELIAEADLVTEMVAVKHPYEQGVGARVGIEY